MKYIESKIIQDGHVLGDDILKVDNFLNHQIDSKFADKVGEFFASSFNSFNKVLTIETSGVAFALSTALHKDYVPIVFAKKSKSKIVDTSSCYMTNIKSFTRGLVSEVIVDKKYLTDKDKVLIIDDFLAEGNAAIGLIDLCKQAGAEIVGVGVVINKSFQGGEDKIKAMGYKVVSGARITAFKDGKAIF